MVRSLIASGFFCCGIFLSSLVHADNLISELQGSSENEKFGSAVAILDDVDGDHVSDFAVAAPDNSDHIYHAGKVSVYSGKKQKLLYVVYGSGAGDQFGTAVAAAGDVNGDGVPDMVVGAPQNDPHCSTISCPDGYPYSYILDDGASTNGTIVYHAIRSGDLGDSVTRSLTFYNSYSGSWQTIGQNIAGTLLDSNNTNYYTNVFCITTNCTDVMKSSYGAIVSRTNTWMKGFPSVGYAPGYVTVLSGRDGAVLQRFQGDAAGDHFGIAVAGGDINNDGHADILVGADGVDTQFIRAGQAKIFSGRTGSVMYSYTGSKAGDLFGLSIAMLSDINNDGYADFVVGAPRADVTAGTDAGAVFLYSGANGQLIRRLEGSSPMDRFGSSIAQQQSGNLLVGAPQSGSCWGNIIPCVHSGNRFTLTIDSSFKVTRSGSLGQSLTWVIEKDGNDVLERNAANETSYQYFGNVSGSYYRIWLQAWNGQYYDIVSNVVEYTPGRSIENTGFGYVDMFNAKTGTLLSRHSSSKKHDQFGTDVSSGDVNADGYEDIMVGASTADVGGIESGAAKVISGKTGAVISQFEGKTKDAKGTKVHAALDLNGDGYDEMIVSSPETFKESGAGKIEIYSTVAIIDSDNDGIEDHADAFPQNLAASVDTDGDGMPDDWNQFNVFACTVNDAFCNGLTLDIDDDNDGVPDYIDAEPLNAAVNTEILLPVNSGYQGSSIIEQSAVQ